MADIAISQESFYFIAVDYLVTRAPVTCAPSDSLVVMAGIMDQHNISGIVAVEDGRPVGLVSLRDLRTVVAKEVTALTTLTVKDIMRTNLITIGRHDYLFKAIFTMAKHNIHRLVVVDDDGSMVGVITNSDFIRIQSRCPIYLNQAITSSETYEQLKATANRLNEMLQFASQAGADTQSLISLITHFNDSLNERLFVLMEQLDGIVLPAGAAFLVLGSEGRGEQTLRTDQDNAIVYDDELSAADLQMVQRFAERVVERMEYLGIPRCPGGTMASNPAWCRSLSGWKEALNGWIGTPLQDNMVSFGMFQDMRLAHGNKALEHNLKEHIITTTHQQELFFTYMAHNIIRFKPPLGMFGRIKTESVGEGKGMLDLKKGGIFALTLGVSLLTLYYGSTGGTTWEKINRLRLDKRVAAADLDVIEESFTFLLTLRLGNQLQAVKRGRTPTNLIDPGLLSDKKQDQLRDALKGVGLMLHILQGTFQTSSVRT